MNVNDASKRILADLLRAETGQDFPVSRRWRIGTALSALCREHGVTDLDAMVASLATSRRTPLARKVVEALLNNETYFFRDRVMFDCIAERVLPDIAQRRSRERTVRVWSVGCSTGQEALSVAMLFAEREAAWSGWSIEIVGTDVSERMVEEARAATYTPFQIQRGLAVGQMVRWFSEAGAGWRATERLRRMVRFEKHNMLDPLPQAGTFDLVLCRNVLLYFDDATRRRAFDRLASALAPEGWLMLGAGETTIGQTDRIVPDRVLRGLYRHAGLAGTSVLPDVVRRAAG